MSHEKTGRNDPCPCGSGKKYKACCFKKEVPQGKKKFKAAVLSGKVGQTTPAAAKPVDLMERTFGAAIARGQQKFEAPKEEQKEHGNEEHFAL